MIQTLLLGQGVASYSSVVYDDTLNLPLRKSLCTALLYGEATGANLFLNEHLHDGFAFERAWLAPRAELVQITENLFQQRRLLRNRVLINISVSARARPRRIDGWIA